MKDYVEAVKDRLNCKRFKHSVSTADEAIKLAIRYGADTDKAHTAGILHDIAKCLDEKEAIATAKKYGVEIDEYCGINTELLHGVIGAAIVKNEFEIDDKEILDAIACHTTGKKGMTLLDKIIYIADLIEPSRDFEGIAAIRKAAYEDLDEAILMASESIIAYVMKRQLVVHPNSIDAYNDIIIQRRNLIGKKV